MELDGLTGTHVQHPTMHSLLTPFLIEGIFSVDAHFSITFCDVSAPLCFFHAAVRSYVLNIGHGKIQFRT